MATGMIDHTALSRLVEAGAVRNAHVVGQHGGWSLLVRYGTVERALVAQRSKQIRVFRRMDTVVSYLRDIGIQQFDVDAVGYEDAGGTRHSRPDRAEALRRAHEAAVHDKWFRRQVETALNEADSPAVSWVNSEDAKTAWEKKRALIAARAASERHS